MFKKLILSTVVVATLLSTFLTPFTAQGYQGLPYDTGFFNGGYIRSGRGYRVLPNGLWGFRLGNNVVSGRGISDLQAMDSHQKADALIDELDWQYNNPSFPGNIGHPYDVRLGVDFVYQTIMNNPSPHVSGSRPSVDLPAARDKLHRFIDDGGVIYMHYYSSYRGENSLMNRTATDTGFYDMVAAGEGPKRNFYSMRFVKDGRLYYELKLDCANPLGAWFNDDFGFVPEHSLSADCSTGVISGSATDVDAPGREVRIELWSGRRGSSGAQRIDGGGNRYTDTSGNFNYGGMRSRLSDGEDLWLYVRDIEPAGTEAWRQLIDGSYEEVWYERNLRVSACGSYNLRPSVGTSVSVADENEDITFTHTVTNDGDVNSVNSSYSAKQFVVRPGEGPVVTDNYSDYFDTLPMNYVYDGVNYSIQPGDYNGVDCARISQAGIYPADDRTNSTQNGRAIQTGCVQDGVDGVQDSNVNFSLGSTEVGVVTVNTASYPPGTKICQVLSVDYADTSGSRHRWSTPTCVTIAKQPSVKIVGGDVAVGRSSDVNLSQNATIGLSYNIIDSTECQGSWMEQSAFAPSVINGLTAGSIFSAGSCGDRSRNLAFANTDGETGMYGNTGLRNYALGMDIANNPNTNQLTAESLENSSGVVNLSSLEAGVYHISSDSDVRVRGRLQKGVTVVVSAPKIYVVNNIRYDDTDGYTSFSEIPQLILRSVGDIVIENNVNRVDGWLVALDTVSTCGEKVSEGGMYYDGLTVDTCNERLVINGAVSAEHLQLRRTGGTRLYNNAAEVINYRDDTVLWQQRNGSFTNGLETQYIHELPPRY